MKEILVFLPHRFTINISLLWETFPYEPLSSVIHIKVIKSVFLGKKHFIKVVNKNLSYKFLPMYLSISLIVLEISLVEWDWIWSACLACVIIKTRLALTEQRFVFVCFFICSRVVLLFFCFKRGGGAPLIVRFQMNEWIRGTSDPDGHN